ncbi:MAG: UbiA prenyltransferase family [Candidatus Parcubacteria bacterium]|jgi:4-hydroxybenzoate polyprenyltransferase
MYAKISSSLELMRFGRSVVTALIVLPVTWRLDHYFIFTLFLLFSFAFNDWVDADMDKDGHPNRPIPSGRVSENEAAVLSFVLLALGIYFSMFYALDLTKLFVYTCVASVVYSWLLKRHVPLVATPIWTICVTFMVLTPTAISTLGWTLFFLVLYTHEVLLDMRDEKSDRIHCTTPSIATLLGQKCWWFVLGMWVLTVLLQKYGHIPIIWPMVLNEPEQFTQLLWRHMTVVLVTGILGMTALFCMAHRNASPLQIAIVYYKTLFILTLQLI